jgi:hypothetical protein
MKITQFHPKSRVPKLDNLILIFQYHIINIEFQVFTAVTMKNSVLWDIKTRFVPRRKNITSPLQN